MIPRLFRPARSILQLAVLAALAVPWAGASACTRVLFAGTDGTVITARSMDWTEDIGTNLYILPRGIERTGEAGPNSIRWVAKYGSVVATGYDISTTDGVNEKGLATNLNWLAESEFPAFGPDSKPGLTVAAWAQYVLDNFATVAEAVAALEQEPFTPVTDTVPGQDRPASVHLAISDATGDSAIIEYLGGKQIIHHGRQHKVMTNSPSYDQQLALNAYWQEIGGTVMLPGTSRAADRFARASFYVDAIPQSGTPDRVLASMFGVIRNASVPLGISTPDRPEISSTRWRSVVDHRRLLYFFESAISPNVFWVDLKKIDFSAETGHVRRLDLGPEQSRPYAGDATDDFVEAEPFKFMGL
jgi:penicillin V acylase-like amidase (Ntn superfamily)